MITATFWDYENNDFLHLNFPDSDRLTSKVFKQIFRFARYNYEEKVITTCTGELKTGMKLPFTIWIKTEKTIMPLYVDHLPFEDGTYILILNNPINPKEVLFKRICRV